jgi:hypothetical protein
MTRKAFPGGPIRDAKASFTRLRKTATHILGIALLFLDLGDHNLYVDGHGHTPERTAYAQEAIRKVAFAA